MDPLLPLLFMYAETHTRTIAGLPGPLFARMPEILFDAPRRCAPGRDLPIVLLLHHVNRFPVTCICVDVALTQHGCAPLQYRFCAPENHRMQCSNSTLTAYIFTIPRHDLPSGTIYITAVARIRRKKKERLVINNNIRMQPPRGLECYVADDDLPGACRCSYGDMHIHTDYSADTHSFGVPVEIVDAMAYAFGLDTAALTDHSYSLSESDWRTQKKEINSPTLRTVVVQGQEVSCINNRNRIVHVCSYGTGALVSGCSDAFMAASRHPGETIQKVCTQIKKKRGCCFAAHPGAKISWPHFVFLNRGKWDNNDIYEPLDGLQAVSGSFGNSWLRAKSLWIRALLRGMRLCLIAGNDTRGDFNGLSIAGPLLCAVREYPNQFFGATRTGLYITDNTRDSMLQALMQGASFITNGPYLALCTDSRTCSSCVSNQHISRTQAYSTFVHVLSTPEYGRIARITLMCGDYDTGREITLIDKKVTHTLYAMQLVRDPDVPLPTRGYLRAEVTSIDPECQSDAPRYAYTSPCYFSD